MLCTVRVRRCALLATLVLSQQACAFRLQRSGERGGWRRRVTMNQETTVDRRGALRFAAAAVASGGLSTRGAWAADAPSPVDPATAFDVVRQEVESGRIKVLEGMVERQAWPDILKYTKELDLSFRKVRRTCWARVRVRDRFSARARARVLGGEWGVSGECERVR